MQFISNELYELSTGLNRIINELKPVFTGGVNAVNNKNSFPVSNSQVNEKSLSAAAEITGYFELMLGSTKNMLANLGLMDSGFAKTVEIIVQLLGSITGSPAGGGLFGGLLGIIGGIFGGPFGAAAGTGIGTMLGSTPNMINSQFGKISAQTPQMINQVIIKNPVTFTKAFDVEVRTRSLRGGIDL